MWCHRMRGRYVESGSPPTLHAKSTRSERRCRSLCLGARCTCCESRAGLASCLHTGSEWRNTSHVPSLSRNRRQVGGDAPQLPSPPPELSRIPCCSGCQRFETWGGCIRGRFAPGSEQSSGRARCQGLHSAGRRGRQNFPPHGGSGTDVFYGAF